MRLGMSRSYPSSPLSHAASSGGYFWFFLIKISLIKFIKFKVSFMRGTVIICMCFLRLANLTSVLLKHDRYDVKDDAATLLIS